MEYLLLIYGNEADQATMTQEQGEQVMAAYVAYTSALQQSGALKSGNPLHPTSSATTIRGSRVLDGPFSETKEQLGGYYLIDVPDLDAALQWAKRCPGTEHGSVEVRPIMVFSAEPIASATTNA